MAIHIRAYDESKNPIGLLSDHSSLMVQHQLNDTGVLSFSYPPRGKDAHVLGENTLFLSIIEDGEEHDERYTLDDDSDNVATDTGDGVLVRCAARGVLALLDGVTVYPAAHTPGTNPSGMTPEHEFKNQSPGAIFTELIRKAKNRGVFGAVTIGIDFTNTHDSAGVAWPKNYTVTYAVGTSYLSLIRAACDNGWCDVRMKGFTLQAFVPDGTMSRKTNVIVRTGQQVQSGPRKRSRRGILTTILGIGAEKNMVEVSDANAIAKFGRREGQASDGRMTENGSLVALTQHELESRKSAQEGFTISMSTTPPLGEKWSIPLKDFRVGEWIQWDQIRKSATELEPLRVRSISVGYQSASVTPTCEVELNDLFVERSIKLERQVQGIVQGSVTAAPPPTTSPGPDATVPKRPAGVAISSTIYEVLNAHRVSASISWPAVGQNLDGSPYTDHDVYLVSWSHDNGNSWSPDSVNKEPFTWIPDLIPGARLLVRVASRDLSGNISDYAVSPLEVLPVDAVAPPRPTAPDVATHLGVSTITWDGISVDGAMPADLKEVVCYTVGAEDEVEHPAAYSGAWAQRGITMNPPGGNVGGAVHFKVVAAPKGTTAGLLLASLASATWSAVKLTVQSLANGTHTLTLTIGATPTVVNLVPLGLAAGAAFNVDVKAVSGTITVSVNGTAVITKPLPAGADYLITNPSSAAGLTVESISEHQVIYYPPGHPKRVGVLGGPGSPSVLTISGQEMLRAYEVWFVAVDQTGNESEPSDRTAFMSTPLVDADLIATTVQAALDEANTALGGIDSALDGFRDDLETVQVSANGKNSIYQTTTAPAGTAHRVGDIWYNPANDNRMQIWSGTAWTPALVGPTALAAAVNNAITAAADTANSAKTSADGKTTNTYSANAASSTIPGKVAGDTWFRRQADGQIIGQWEWSGSAWVARTVNGAVLSAVDAGKITVGTLDAARIAADSIGVTKLAVGSFDNLVPDPQFTNGAGDWGTMSGAYSIDATGSRAGKTAFKVVNSGVQQGKYSPVLPVQPGARYLLRCWVKSDVEIPAGGIGLFVSSRNAAGASVGVNNASSTHPVIPANTWTEVTGMSSAIPATAVGVAFGVYSQAGNATGSVWFDSFSSTRAAAGELIVDGSITTGKLATGSITAESGIIASLDAGKITVGTLNAARIAAGSLNATKLLIGDGENLFANGNGQTGTNADFPGFTYDAADTPGDGDAVGSFACSTRSTLYGSARPKIRPEEKYRVSVWLKADLAGSRFYLQIRGFDKAGTAVASVPLYVVSNVELATYWQRFDAEIVFPWGVDYCRPDFFMNHVNGSVITTQRVAGFSMRRMNAGELIVDGSITANKIAARTIIAENLAAGTITANEIKAGSITADKIAANAITADKIKAGAIDGTIITGATFRTNESAWRMELDNNGLRATDSSPSGVGQMTLTRSGIDASFATLGSLNVGSVYASAGIRTRVDMRGEVSQQNGYGFMQRIVRDGIPETGISFDDTAFATGGGQTTIQLWGQGKTKNSSITARIFTTADPANYVGAHALVLEGARDADIAGNLGIIYASGRDLVVDAAWWTNADGTQGTTGAPASVYQGDAWIPLALNSGWSNYSSGYSVAASKRIGTRIFLRGLVRYNGIPPANSIIANAPAIAGPRDGHEIFPVAGSTAYAEVQVNGANSPTGTQKGALMYRTGITAAVNWLSLAGVSWQLG